MLLLIIFKELPCNVEMLIQLSQGEVTLRDALDEVIRNGSSWGFISDQMALVALILKSGEI